MLVVSTNLKRESSNVEDGLCSWVQLTVVNILLIPSGCETTDLRDDNAIVNYVIHGPPC